jgi:hypothetical protein
MALSSWKMPLLHGDHEPLDKPKSFCGKWMMERNLPVDEERRRKRDGGGRLLDRRPTGWSFERDDACGNQRGVVVG